MLGCKEKLPVRVEPEEVAKGKIKLANNNPYVTIPWGITRPYLTTFMLGVENIFDETLESYMDINSKIDIWLEDSLKTIKTLEYKKLDKDKKITLDRGSIYWVKMVWDQYDNQGNPLWSYINPKTDTVYNSSLSDTLKFTAKGEIRIFTKVAKVKAEMKFQVRYIIR
ncbi:hypothetical protein DRQ09_06190 [candidate division KSB1 bacterium]|nr:MAG: hypothetical protein DRQ09_06190 [candidate division KSB1 bacterium]